MTPAILKFSRCLIAGVILGISSLSGQGQVPTAAELRELIEQNRRLQEQVTAQQSQIDELRLELTQLLRADTRRETEFRRLREEVADASGPAQRPGSGRLGEVRISGEAGLAYFDGGSQSAFPAGSFRADDVKLYIETPVWKDTYLFTELDLVTREANDEFFHMGEVYVDFENVSGRLGGPDGFVNLRVGRFDIPFGEEYQFRGVMDNPLISHSLGDLWGVDEGIEIYGSAGRWSYVAAVQNGGHKTLEDFDSDKSVTVRVGFDPADWFHLSASAMRTGDLNVAGDSLSEIWFGGGFFRALGPATRTTIFHANLFELDAVFRWKSGSLRAAGGRVRFDDDDTAADNSRSIDYYYVEAVQAVTGKLYGAARYSRIDTDRGYPLVGHGDFGQFLFRSAPTDHLWRLSLGLGYRLADPLVFKFEYSLEDGRLVNGQPRNEEDLLSAELGLRF